MQQAPSEGEQVKLDAAKTTIDQPQFANKSVVREMLKRGDIKGLSDPISIELTRQKLAMEYPMSKGYEIQTGVKIYKDSRF